MWYVVQYILHLKNTDKCQVGGDVYCIKILLCLISDVWGGFAKAWTSVYFVVAFFGMSFHRSYYGVYYHYGIVVGDTFYIYIYGLCIHRSANFIWGWGNPSSHPSSAVRCDQGLITSILCCFVLLCIKYEILCVYFALVLYKYIHYITCSALFVFISRCYAKLYIGVMSKLNELFSRPLRSLTISVYRAFCIWVLLNSSYHFRPSQGKGWYRN